MLGVVWCCLRECFDSDSCVRRALVKTGIVTLLFLMLVPVSLAYSVAEYELEVWVCNEWAPHHGFMLHVH
jgi:hypothetical protein